LNFSPKKSSAFAQLRKFRIFTSFLCGESDGEKLSQTVSWRSPGAKSINPFSVGLSSTARAGKTDEIFQG
jgi:hypothetical protein